MEVILNLSQKQVKNIESVFSVEGYDITNIERLITIIANDAINSVPKYFDSYVEIDDLLDAEIIVEKDPDRSNNEEDNDHIGSEFKYEEFDEG